MASVKEASPLVMESPPSASDELGYYGHHAHGLTVLTTVVFAVGEMAGTGILALPNAVAGMGFTGIAVIVVFTLVSAFTGVLLGKCWIMVLEQCPDYRRHARNPYPSIGQEVWGRFGKFLVSISINITLFGVAVVFLLLSSDNIQSVVKEAGWADISFCYYLLIVAAFLCPITFLGTPKDFWPIAVGAVLATSIACVVLLISMFIESDDQPPAFYPAVNFDKFFVAFGTTAFAFGGHPVFPTIQSDMRNPEDFGKAIFLSYIVVLVMYLPVAVAGYVIYGSVLTPNVLDAISTGPLKFTVLVLITLHLICSFVIVINPVMQECEELLRIPPGMSWKRMLFRTILVGTVLFAGETVPHFGVILSFIGASTSMLQCYCLPVVFYLKLSSKANRSVPLHIKCLCLEIIVVSVLGLIVATYSSGKSLIEASFSSPCYIKGQSE